jgi:hypothetical protein
VSEQRYWALKYIFNADVDSSVNAPDAGGGGRLPRIISPSSKPQAKQRR